MSKQPAHRPRRSFPNARRVIVECELEECIHCRQPLVPSKSWHVRKAVQTMNEPLFVAGKTRSLLGSVAVGVGIVALARLAASTP